MTQGRNFKTEARWQFNAIVILVNIVCMLPNYQLPQTHTYFHVYTLNGYLMDI